MVEREKQIIKQERSTFIYKDLEPDLLGREIYADDITTPYSFYLVRKLILGRDYQSLAEGELFFDVLCDSWDIREDFDELFVKKMYVQVETQSMTYSLLIGSFEPTSRATRSQLKQWLEAIEAETTLSMETGATKPIEVNDTIQSMAKQMLETSNEIFRLRQMINELIETVNQQAGEYHTFKKQPVISRNIKTIHLKRAQPLLTPEKQQQEPSVVQTIQNVHDSADKTTDGMTKEQEPLTKDQLDEGPTIQEQGSLVKKRQWSLRDSKKQFLVGAIPQPLSWRCFFEQLTDKPCRSRENFRSVSKEADEAEQEQIYQSFVTTSKRLGEKNKRVKKESILRTELLSQISQAEYLPYSWGEVLQYRQEDLLICQRLSTSQLVAGLDACLAELRTFAYSRFSFGKKVRCPENLLKQLTGYILLDQYLKEIIGDYQKVEKVNA